MDETCSPGRPCAGRTYVGNSPAAEQFRRRIQHGKPYGALERVAHRTGRAVHVVQHQIEGNHLLSVAVAVELLAELPQPIAAQALSELVAPLGLVCVPREPDADQLAREIAEARAHLEHLIQRLEGAK